jgi:hypothetical protein
MHVAHFKKGKLAGVATQERYFQDTMRPSTQRLRIAQRRAQRFPLPGMP